jgi:hypothetical protein
MMESGLRAVIRALCALSYGVGFVVGLLSGTLSRMRTQERRTAKAVEKLSTISVQSVESCLHKHQFKLTTSKRLVRAKRGTNS